MRILWRAGIGAIACRLVGGCSLFLAASLLGAEGEWTLEFPGEPTRAVVAADGRVVIGLRFPSRSRPLPEVDSVVSLSPQGQKLWAYPTQYGVVSAPVIGPGGIVYFTHTRVSPAPTGDYLTALDPAGSLIWSRRVSAASFAGPEISVGADGMIVVQASGLSAYFENGSQIWSTAKLRSINKHASLGLDGTLFIALPENGFTMLPSDAFFSVNPPPAGAWTASWGPAAIDSLGRAWAFNDRSEIAAFATPRQMLHLVSVPQDPEAFPRTFPTASSTFSPVIGEDGVIYAIVGRGSERSRLAAVEPNGKLKWAVTVTNQLISPPAVAAGGLLYACVVGKQVLEISPEGRTLRTFELGHEIRTPPVLTHDGALLISGPNQLTALRPGLSFPVNAPWPMDRADAAGTSSRSLTAGVPEVPVISAIQEVVGANRLHWARISRPALYEIYRTERPQPFPLEPLAIVSSAAGLFDDTNALAGVSYLYSLKARNSGGVSQVSAPTHIRTIPERVLWSRKSNRIWGFLPGLRGEVFLSETLGDHVGLTTLGPDGTVLRHDPVLHHGLCLSAAGNLYSFSGGRLLETGPEGQVVRFLELGEVLAPQISVGIDGNLWLSVHAKLLINLRPDFRTNWISELPRQPIPDGISLAPTGEGYFLTPEGGLNAFNPSGSSFSLWPGPILQPAMPLPLGLHGEVLLQGSSHEGVYTVVRRDAAGGGYAAGGIAAVSTQLSPLLMDEGGFFYSIALGTEGPHPVSGISSNRLCRWNPDASLSWQTPVSGSASLAGLGGDGGVLLTMLGGLQWFGRDGVPGWSFRTSPSGAASLGVDGRIYFASTVDFVVLETRSLLAEGGWVAPLGNSRATRSPRIPTHRTLRAEVIDGKLRVRFAEADAPPAILLQSETMELWRRVDFSGPSREWNLPLKDSADSSAGRFYRVVSP